MPLQPILSTLRQPLCSSIEHLLPSCACGFSMENSRLMTCTAHPPAGIARATGLALPAGVAICSGGFAPEVHFSSSMVLPYLG